MTTQQKIRHVLKHYGTMMAAVIIILIFSLLRPDAFFTLQNLVNISRQISLLVIVAIGATLIMVMEEFDLSLGSLASLGGIIGATLAVKSFPIFFAMLIAVLCCALIGLFSGWLITKFNILSFITTLAMSTIITGIIFAITGGSTVFQGVPKSYRSIGTTMVYGVPLLTIIMILLTVIFWFIMRHTPFGRKLYAIGGNPRAAFVSGIPVKKMKVIAFALCAGLSGLAGVLLSSRLGSAHPSGGDGLFLQAYAAVFLGKTMFRGGVANIWGTLVGSIILGVLANGLTIMQVPTFMQDLLTGCIIILALVLQKIGAKTDD
ncbi:MAG: ABC transporter permease [Christensenellales bacterium]|jgi:ribose transport system permease protein|nr:ABC transporter permease [Christensenellaceae bacterium]